MKTFLLIFLSFLLISCEVKSQENQSVNYINTEDKFSQKISEIKDFVKDSDYNSNKAFLIDFSIASSKFRFFVIDIKTGKILQKALVAHGDGSENGKTKNGLKFSNLENSHCSSLGKYLIEEKYKGQFGLSYRLTGLDETNSNARKRAIVLHRLSCVPDVEQKTDICLSFGCPMVSDDFFKILEQHIDKSNKKIILYAYN
ncbi:murein L,D-transpeptidase catalytic domain-containing protein [Epilithonimonas zeae]|uniref:L,D-transpeptidase catalytic domain n=1 Tax=Epilithonimonas zeae TaxID=1416779 RepID=A0A1N6FL75_9FLAO|nr:murein L,D-transpeptidase catalytic domain family protein [Epilithonimonas zeae]SIN96004.1 L,D-transpeptidase catalytic domain [Epilithonimonas zeae]